MAGFHNAAPGLGETGFFVAHRLEQAGIPSTTLSLQYDFMIAVTPVSGLGNAAAGPSQGQPGISLLSMKGDHLPGFVAGGGGAFLEYRYIIGIWFWKMLEMRRVRDAAAQDYVRIRLKPLRFGQEIRDILREAASRSAVFQSLARLRDLKTTFSGLWQTFTVVRQPGRNLTRLSRARRHALSQLHKAAKDQHPQQQTALDHTQRYLDRLTGQLSTMNTRRPAFFLNPDIT